MATVVLPTLSNNGITTLATGIDNSTTTVVVSSAAALGFSDGATDRYMTIIDVSNYRKNPAVSPETLEVVNVTNVSTNTLTVTRGVDGTSGTAFSAGAIIEVRNNAAHLQRVYDALTDGNDEIKVSGIVVGAADIDPVSERGASIGSATLPFADANIEVLNLLPSNAGSQPTRYHTVTGNVSGTTASNWVRINVDDGSPGTRVPVMEFRGDQNLVANGNVSVTGKLLVSTQETPASAAATGIKGTIAHDTNYIYICTAANTWKRVAIATW